MLKKLFYYIYLVLTIYIVITISAKSLLCTEEYCDTYRDQFSCPTISYQCTAQNSTHNGRLFPSDTPCSCCDICFVHLGLGDDCPSGTLPGAPVPSSICGPGLYCVFYDNDSHATCQIMESTACTIAQKKFDDDERFGNIGTLMKRPECDQDGLYKPVKCVPDQTCHCLDQEGNRIFGEAIYSTHLEFLMQCACSRLALESNVIPQRYPGLTARCDESGSFDSLQCIGELCFCIDARSGDPMTDTIVNITETGVAQLPCFNRHYNKNQTYFRDCEDEQNKLLNWIYEAEHLYETNVVDFQMAKCQPDGWYDKVQEDNTVKFCADKYKKLIENFSVLKTSPDAQTMNCNCARTRHLLMENNANNANVPVCCPNGNFKKIYCRNGDCYCVDENGLQISSEQSEDNISLLSCYENLDENYC